MMNPCVKYEEWMSAYVDGVLSDAERDEFLAHIEACPSCREVLAEYEMLSGALEDMDVMPPATLSADIMAKIQAKPELTVVRRGSMVRRVMAIAAVFAVVAFVGIQMFGPTSPMDIGGAGDSISAAPEMPISPMSADMHTDAEAETEDYMPAPASSAEARGPIADTVEPEYLQDEGFEPLGECESPDIMLSTERSLFEVFVSSETLWDWDELRGKLEAGGYSYEMEDGFFLAPDPYRPGSYLYGMLVSAWSDTGDQMVTILGYAYWAEDGFRRVELREADGEVSYYYDVAYVGQGGTPTETWTWLRTFLLFG